MKPTKAIEILSCLLADRQDLASLDLSAAVKLGIEALKFFKDLEDRGALPSDARLPGEDPE